MPSVIQNASGHRSAPTAAFDVQLRERIADARDSGNGNDAERLLRKRLTEAPNDAEAMISLADAIVARNEDEAIGLLYRALAAAPAAHDARLKLSWLHQKRSQFPPALELLQQVPPKLRRTFELKAREAALLGSLGRRNEEIAIYHKLAKERPENATLWMGLGTAYSYAGRSDKAVEAEKRAIEIAPTYGEPWWTLANMKNYRFSESEVETMRSRLRDDLSPTDALHFHFALGRALELRGEYERSFEHYASGNRLRAAVLNPRDMQISGFVDAMTAFYTPDLFNRLEGAGPDSNEPIFVMGLQRSGSTLIEQILASHPDVEGTTELMTMQHLSDDFARRNGGNLFQAIARAGHTDFRQMGEEYLVRTRAFRQLGRARFVDKLPGNWMHVGLIRLALPNAKIIDARRHPMACGFSNFAQHYATGVNFAYSQWSIGTYYRDYWRVMQHFDKVQPHSIHRVLNEELVEDLEGTVRRMLEYLDLPFNEACLEFYKSKRAVHTPSAEQVRRPISAEGLDHWRHYDSWLEPLKRALGPALESWTR